jgi:DNA invertase Pin-like site-specific DNA recombinase
MQIRELKEYCECRGWTVAGIYADTGFSGAKDSRPELNRLMADAHRRRFDVVAVYRFDRFGRSVSHLLRALETFRALGIEFTSISEQLDTSTPTGKLVFTILGALAEMERCLIVDRVRSGMRNARAKGVHVGRPPLRSFSAAEAEQIRMARKTEKSSIRQLAIQFKTTQWMVSRILAEQRAGS